VKVISGRRTYLSGYQVKKLVIAAAFALGGICSAQAADLAARPYTKAPPIAGPVYNWTGFYIGGNVGYGWGNADTNFASAPLTGADIGTTLSPDPRGVFGGAQVGYNWQFGSLVTGLEADFQGSDIKRSVTQSPILSTTGASFGPGSFLTAQEKINWFGTVRGRLGFTATPALLLYATGGFAYGDVGYSANTIFPAIQYPSSLYSKTKAGWTAGAGAEWAFARNWSAKVEYLYMDLGSESSIGNPVPPNPPFLLHYNWKTQANLVRVGINYKFGGPVVAKY
jgi:outer membrane immunogenic protein